MKTNNTILEFNRAFIGEDLPKSNSIFKYSMYINHPYLKYIFFVEGKSDMYFYKECLNEFERDETYFIYNGEVGGKKSVIDMFNYCKQDIKRRSNGKGLYFIIDKDYENIEYVLKTQEEKEGITVLPCYSFENYYFRKDCEKIIFDQYFTKDNTLFFEEFNNYLQRFVNIILKYCAYKKTCVFHEIKDVKIGRDIEDEFRNVDFNRKKLFDDNLLRKVQIEIEESIKYNTPLFNTMYRKYVNELRDSILDIKGKILFSFLIDYLKHKKNLTIDEIELKKELYKLSSRFNINLDLKEVR